MVSEPHEWTVPAPLRALLWWPGIAFVLVMLDPTAAAGTIAVAGAALAVLGVVGSAVGAALRRRLQARNGDATRPALSMTDAAERVGPLAVDQQAA
jgi:hypothetical protein